MITQTDRNEIVSDISEDGELIIYTAVQYSPFDLISGQLAQTSIDIPMYALKRVTTNQIETKLEVTIGYFTYIPKLGDFIDGLPIVSIDDKIAYYNIICIGGNK